MKTVPEIYTKRGLLREIQERDIPSLREIFQDLDTQKYLPELCKLVTSDEGIRLYLISSRNAFMQGEGILWGIFMSDTLVGFIGVIDLSSEPAFYYAVHPEYRNKGWMTEVMDTVLGYLQQYSICTHLQTEIIKGNISSQRILSRYEFKLIETIENRLLYYKDF